MRGMGPGRCTLIFVLHSGLGFELKFFVLSSSEVVASLPCLPCLDAKILLLFMELMKRGRGIGFGADLAPAF
jgi:hypothetical protein